MPALKRRVAKNTTALLATRLINQVAGFLLVVYATRKLGVEGFGKYSFVVAFYLVFEMISFFGLANFLPREIGRRREEAARYFVHAAAVVAAVAAVLVVVMNVAALYYHLPTDASRAMLVISLALVPAALGAAAEATFIGIEKAEFITLFTFVKRALVTGVSIAALAAGYGLVALVAVRAGAEVLAAAAVTPTCVYFARRTAGEPARFFFEWQFAKRLFAGAIPFAALAVLAAIYWRLDVLMLQRLRGAVEVGIYSASYRLMFLLTLIPESFMNAVYPNLARAWREDKPQFVRLGERSLRYLVALALPAAAGAFVLAKPVVLLIFAQDFARSVVVFSVLIFAVIPIYINNVYYRALFAAEQQLKSVFILVINIVVMVGAGWLLIPRWGATGAAAALLISLGAAFVQNYAVTFVKVYRSKLGGAFARTALAAVAMATAVWFIRPHLPWPLAAVAGAAAYFPLLFVLRVLGPRDLAAWREIVGVSPQTNRAGEP